MLHIITADFRLLFDIDHHFFSVSTGNIPIGTTFQFKYYKSSIHTHWIVSMKAVDRKHLIALGVFRVYYVACQ